MYRVWVKDHILPIGAESEKAIEEIKEVYGDSILSIEEIKE